LKLCEALTLDGLMVEGINYTLAEGEKINPSDDVDGHPLYYYTVVLNPSTNKSGQAFPGLNAGSNTTGVVLVVDSLAMGLPSGSLVTINLDGE
jgi:hypothetical protein